MMIKEIADLKARVGDAKQKLREAEAQLFAAQCAVLKFKIDDIVQFSRFSKTEIYKITGFESFGDNPRYLARKKTKNGWHSNQTRFWHNDPIVKIAATESPAK